MSKTTVIFHSADFDGIFCREIAKKFLPDAEFIGWNYGDPLVHFPNEGIVYLMDLSPDCFESLPTDSYELENRFIWIDHHKSAIEKFSKNLSGYRIDGVAACRLAWQWFSIHKMTPHPEEIGLPDKQHFIDRKVVEPYAVRLAGEYDIWDKRDPNAELFQYGLKTQPLTVDDWAEFLRVDPPNATPLQKELSHSVVTELLEKGRALKYAREQEYKEVILCQGFDAVFAGNTYLACNSHELDIRSQLFEAGIKSHHEGLLGFTWTGSEWRVSLYGIPGKDIDHSLIAVSYGGGGHKNACGFRTKTLPFLPCS
jgi:oligoribonuclease NrnB/cAMP/cGMP phosphodiesterase (DHH superfamily)